MLGPGLARELLGEQEPAVGAVEGVEEAVLVRVDQRLDIPAVDREIRQDDLVNPDFSQRIGGVGSWASKTGEGGVGRVVPAR